MDQVLTGARVMTDEGLKDGLAVRLRGERILAVGPAEEIAEGASVRDLGGGLLLAGFIDIQVNGGGGLLFNDAPTVESIARIGQAHRRFGATGFLPTLISDDLDTVSAGIGAVRHAIEQGVPGVLGLHIEGPFLNPRRKGIHDASKLRRIDEAAFELLTSLGRGRTLVTLAPETTSPEMIERLHRAGVIVSAGHTNASYDAVRAALGRRHRRRSRGSGPGCRSRRSERWRRRANLRSACASPRPRSAAGTSGSRCASPGRR